MSSVIFVMKIKRELDLIIGKICFFLLYVIEKVRDWFFAMLWQLWKLWQRDVAAGRRIKRRLLLFSKEEMSVHCSNPRENTGYGYDKRAPALRWCGAERMVNSALRLYVQLYSNVVVLTCCGSIIINVMVNPLSHHINHISFKTMNIEYRAIR